MTKLLYKLALIMALFFVFPTFSDAQSMSDDKVISYVQSALKQGKSQQEIFIDLRKQGVSIEQLKRIKKKYEASQSSDFVGETISKKKSRMREPSKEIKSRRIKDLNKKKSQNSKDKDKDKKDYYEAMNFLIPDSLQTDLWNEKEEEEKIKIFGHSIFANKELTFEPDLNIATPIDYQLGPGDEVIIDIWGASQATIQEKISPDGAIQVENLGPVYLNGMTIKQANRHIQNKFSEIYAGITGENPNSYIKLTLGQTRTIKVNIMGEVAHPGTYQLSAFATVFNALYMANGVNKIGSLREVKVYRANRHIATLDVYAYLLKGKIDNDIRLRDNDVVVIPPYDSLVDVVGKVKRPMFYEMKKGETMQDLINYAGGLRGDAYRKSLRVIRQLGNEHQIFTVTPPDFSSFKVMDGDSVTVDSVLTTYANKVEIKGAIYRPGAYQISPQINSIKTLILAAEGIKGDAFMNRAVMHRENNDLTTTARSIDIKGILNGTAKDIQLKKNDIVFIPSIHDLQEGRTVTIYGEVAFPGIYKYASNSTLEDLVLQSGGLLESASTVRVDVARRIKNPKATSTTDVIAKTYTFSLKDGFVVDGEVGFKLKPYDEVYVRRSPGYQEQQNIEIEGEVLYAGKYALVKKNQRISEIIKTAGGLTPEAYAKGARLERKMTTEEIIRMRTLLRMANAGGKDSISTKTLDLGTTYYVGIRLDKALTNPGSDADIVLHEGDKIYVPQFTNTVKINGAVMYPNTVSFKAGEKVKYYINMAGGYGLNAKKSRAYVIYMNGTVARLRSRDRQAIQPGCEIIVPTKKKGRGLSLPEILSIGSSTASIATMLATISNLFK